MRVCFCSSTGLSAALAAYQSDRFDDVIPACTAEIEADGTDKHLARLMRWGTRRIVFHNLPCSILIWIGRCDTQKWKLKERSGKQSGFGKR